MTDDRLRFYGVLLLRLALGTMFIAHSVIYMLNRASINAVRRLALGVPGISAPLGLLSFSYG